MIKSKEESYKLSASTIAGNTARKYESSVGSVVGIRSSPFFVKRKTGDEEGDDLFR